MDFPLFLILLLFLVACLGHLLLSIASHNYWYGQPLNRHVTDLVQFLHALLALAGPILFLTCVGWNLTLLFQSANRGGGFWQIVGAGYVSLCWLTALIIFPLLTWKRLSYRPKPLIQESSRRVDIAEKLGGPPVGDGKYRSLVKLPGNEIFQINLVERALHLPQIPEVWEGLTILHLSDLHFHGTPDRAYFREVVELCNEWSPDLIALTGDYIDSTFHQRWVIPILGRLQSKIATLAILGNHDLWFEADRLRRRLRRMKFVTFCNDWQQLEVRGEMMTVIGHEGPWIKPAPDLGDCPQGFRLCLSHTPDNIVWAQEHQIDLMLSGHVHGGQIRLPVVGSVVVPSIYGRRYDRGVFEESPTLLHVTSGVAGKHPIRYGCPPEAVLIRLTRENGPS